MTVQAVTSTKDTALLLSANQQLEHMYCQRHDPCLALHISRNYHLLLAQNESSNEQAMWHEKAKLWWDVYCSKRSNKVLDLFYDGGGLFSIDQDEMLTSGARV